MRATGNPSCATPTANTVTGGVDSSPGRASMWRRGRAVVATAREPLLDVGHRHLPRIEGDHDGGTGEGDTDRADARLRASWQPATFALGTAAGDLTASTLGLGYLGSAVLFAVLFAAPGVAYWRLGLGPTIAFWLAYVVTRPLGATVADWLGKPVLGGLGLGDGPIAVVLGVLIVGFVAYLTVSRADVLPAAAGPQSASDRHRTASPSQRR